MKSPCRILGRAIVLLYKSNNLDSLIAACGAISKRGILLFTFGMPFLPHLQSGNSPQHVGYKFFDKTHFVPG
jgi:hypothetical protein